MSIYSARKKLESLENPEGYCFPLSLDAILKRTELPNEYYSLFSTEYASGKGSFNECVGLLIKNFFGAEPSPDTDNAPLAKYHAFGASPQPYCPDAAYDYTGQDQLLQDHGVTHTQLRLKALLKNARDNRCNVLFNNSNNFGEHVSGIDLIDPGVNSENAAYVIRDMVDIQNDKVYSSFELAGMNRVFGGRADEYTPLPEVTKHYFPSGETSWELIILPPEPQN